MSWNTANDAVLAEGKRVLIDDPARFDGVTTIGVDEHVWRHTRRGDKYVTVIIDLTGPRTGRRPGPAAGHGRGPLQAGVQDLARRTRPSLARRVEVVAMDGFTGFKTATTEELPDAVAVMDPFHVVRLAGDALDKCRRRIQQHLHGHRGRTGDPLYSARRTLHTGTSLLTDKQKSRLDALFADDDHVEVEATWGVYQRMIAAYREPDRARGRDLMNKLITSLSSGVPAALAELRTLGRTLKQRAADVLAYFDRPGTSNGPTEAINGRLEHLRGSALGFRNLTNYIARPAPLQTGGFTAGPPSPPPPFLPPPPPLLPLPPPPLFPPSTMRYLTSPPPPFPSLSTPTCAASAPAPPHDDKPWWPPRDRLWRALDLSTLEPAWPKLWLIVAVLGSHVLSETPPQLFERFLSCLVSQLNSSCFLSAPFRRS